MKLPKPPDPNAPPKSVRETILVAARLSYSALRFDSEAKYGGGLGKLCEIEVHQAGIRSNRAQGRSALFFYCMLAAQSGVAIASLSLAIRRRNIFWTIAATAVAVAVAVIASGYVYLFI